MAEVVAVVGVVGGGGRIGFMCRVCTKSVYQKQRSAAMLYEQQGAHRKQEQRIYTRP